MSYWMEKLQGLMAGQSAGPKDTAMMSGHYMPQGMGGAMPEMQEMSPDEMVMDPRYNNLEDMGPMAPEMPSMSPVSDTVPNDPSTLTVEAKAKLEKPVMKPALVKSLEDIKAMEQGMVTEMDLGPKEDPRVQERFNRGSEARLNSGLKKTPQEINDRINGHPRVKPTLQQRYR